MINHLIMGLAWLILLYVITAAALTAGTAWMLRRLRRRPASWRAILILNLLPLAFTGAGFLPGRTLAPNGLLAGVPPWCHPDLVAQFEAGSSPPANPLLVDPLSQFQPWRHAARGGLLLDPATNAGAALLGNGQSAVLFPLELAARLLPPPRAATYGQAARLLLAVWGMFLLLRALTLTEAAALAGATVWVGCGFLQFWRLHPHSYVAALAPWILLGMLRLVRRPGPRNAVAPAAAGALGVFAGHPETLLHGVVLGALLALLLGSRARVVASVRWGAVAAGLAFLLAAPALLPLLENLPVSYEWQERIAHPEAVVELEAPWGEVALRAAANLDPFALGDPRQGLEHWRGPENPAEVAGGAVALAALALLPVALGRGRHRRMVLAWLVVGLLGLAVAAQVPGVARPVEWVPLLRDSLVKRWGLWWALAASVGAAVAWQRLHRSHRSHRSDRSRRGGAWRAVAFGAVVLAGLLFLLRSALPVARSPEAVLAAPVVLALVVPAAWGVARGTATVRRWAGALLFILLLLPPAMTLGRWVPTVGSVAFYPETPAVSYVQERLAAESQGYRVAGLDSALTPHAATFFGFEDPRGYDPVAFAPYVEFLRPLAPPRRDEWTRLQGWDHPILDFLGVRYLFDHPSMYPFHHPGVVRRYAGEDALVFENPDALPRLYAPRWVEVTAEPVLALTDPQRLTVSGGGDSAPLPAPGLYDNGGVRVLAWEVGRGSLRAEVEVQGSGDLALLATSQPAIPGWRARLDGEAVPPVRVQGAFLGVVLDSRAAGRRQVELFYRPTGWVWGLGLAFLGVPAGVFLWFGAFSFTGGFPRRGRAR